MWKIIKKIAEVARNKNAEVIVICFYLVLAHIYGVLELSASITWKFNKSTSGK